MTLTSVTEGLNSLIGMPKAIEVYMLAEIRSHCYKSSINEFDSSSKLGFSRPLFVSCRVSFVLIRDVLISGTFRSPLLTIMLSCHLQSRYL